LNALTSGATFGITKALKRRIDPWKNIGKAAEQILPIGKKHS
jgi:hypothetical protein